MKTRPAALPLLIALVLGTASSWPASAAVQSDSGQLGTLFYSPAERLSVEGSRSGEKSGPISYGKTLSLKGLVRRGPGKGTSWINGQTVPEGQAVPAAGIPVISSRQVTIDGEPLRVGETLDVETGARSDLIPDTATVKHQK